MKKVFFKHGLLLIIIFAALAVRLYRVHYPLLDWHSWRQADTASVTQNYLNYGIDLLRPTYHDLSNIPNGLENPEGYRMVEFPIINAGIASLIKILPALPLVPTSRVVSILFSLGTLVSLFFLVKDLSGKKVAYITAAVFAFLPYSVYYSRVILPEPQVLCFSVFSLMAFNNWLKHKRASWYILSVISLALAFLLKPFVGFFAPAYLALSWFAFKKKLFLNPWLYLYSLLAVAPFFAWRNWITQFPEGIPSSDWLFNGNGIRLRPAWFRWLGYERLTKLMLGFTGLVFIPFAFAKVSKDTIFYMAWWIGAAAYLVVIATGNVQHDYYQALLIPILSATVGKGVVALYQQAKSLWEKKFPHLRLYGHLASFALVSLLFILMLFFSWQNVKGNFNVNNWEYYRAGQVVQDKTPEDALVIAPQMGDTAFLFQTNRKGWPIGGGIDEKIRFGATHYVSASFDKEAQELSEKYFVIEKTEEYVLIDLTTRREAQP